MSDEPEKKEKGETKWAAEVDACIRLFERRGMSWWGLLLVQMGWGALANLGAHFFRETGSDIVMIKAPYPFTKEFDLRDVYLWGAIASTVLWLLVTDSFTVPRLVMRRARFFLIWLLGRPGFVLGALIALPLTLLRLPFERRGFARWKAAFPGEKRKQIETLAQDTQKSLFHDQGGFRADWLWHTINRRLIAAIRSLASRAVVGIAPAASVNLQESVQAARDQGAGMANGFGRIRRRLRQVRALPHLEFVTLPPSCQVTREDRAVRLQRRLSLDVLLWGPYVASGSSVRQLNFALPLPITPDPSDSGEARVASERDPFDRSLPFEHASVLVDEQSSQDCYLMAVLTVLLVFEVRRTLSAHEPKTSKMANAEKEWTDFIRYSDPFYVSDRDERELMFHLGFDVLPKLPAMAAVDALGTNASLSQVLVELISRWNGGQLGRIRLNEGDENAFNHTMAKLAALVAERLPNDPRVHYRKAAWACLCEDESATRDALSRAAELDRQLEWYGDISLGARATVQLSDLEKNSMAEALCHATRALAVGGERARKWLQTEWKETPTYHLASIYESRSESASEPALLARSLVERLLHETIMTGLKNDPSPRGGSTPVVTLPS